MVVRRVARELVVLQLVCTLMLLFPRQRRIITASELLTPAQIEIESLLPLAAVAHDALVEELSLARLVLRITPEYIDCLLLVGVGLPEHHGVQLTLRVMPVGNRLGRPLRLGRKTVMVFRLLA